ncbi:MAG: hypothetical protein AB1553_01785 [Nitrospirota bacterium]
MKGSVWLAQVMPIVCTLLLSGIYPDSLSFWVIMAFVAWIFLSRGKSDCELMKCPFIKKGKG